MSKAHQLSELMKKNVSLIVRNYTQNLGFILGLARFANILVSRLEHTNAVKRIAHLRGSLRFGEWSSKTCKTR